ncbi:intradiol ring-cleavage dioxygenase [Streptomyces paludis]|uniref:Dioxygenase n=1 Tax=Streptomyces paludis TaxID=2282738 RepID=A0A345HPZ2_9ACTN|nr:intradiol ring-cleavage dioxygenase [Streptomyces paludis]AXG78766.1 dioxygenase [Streptomyces paludis]
MTETQPPKHKKDLTRRRVIVAGSAAVAATGIGAIAVTTASAGEETAAQRAAAAKAGGGKATTKATEVCYTLTSQTTEGPYYIDADKIRKDITEDKEGIPFTLRLKVIDSESCAPVKAAAIDIWHCDATGIYSGYEAVGSGGGGAPGGGTPPTDAPTGEPTGEPPTDGGGPGGGGGGGGHEEPTDDERYLRGTQLTDKKGFVEFTTLFPGWYQGRAVHIHVKVHVDGKLTDSGYEGGHTCHTGQFFFEEAAVLETESVEPYATNAAVRTTLTQDTIYDQSGVTGGLLKLTYKKKNDIARGVVGTITVGVDPDETNDGTSL